MESPYLSKLAGRFDVPGSEALLGEFSRPIQSFQRALVLALIHQDCRDLAAGRGHANVVRGSLRSLGAYDSFHGLPRTGIVLLSQLHFRQPLERLHLMFVVVDTLAQIQRSPDGLLRRSHVPLLALSS